MVKTFSYVRLTLFAESLIIYLQAPYLLFVDVFHFIVTEIKNTQTKLLLVSLNLESRITGIRPYVREGSLLYVTEFVEHYTECSQKGIQASVDYGRVLCILQLCLRYQYRILTKRNVCPHSNLLTHPLFRFVWGG